MGVNMHTAAPMPFRFWDKVLVGDGCWEWQAGTQKHNGYGSFSMNGRDVKAHRVSWLLWYGEIPKGLRVLHRCDNPPCIRPDHLFLGTQKDNVLDAVAKGRHSMLKQTQCSRGHLFDEVNTYVDPKGRRRCRTCSNEAERQQRAARPPRQRACPQGHPLTEDNRVSNGGCRICARVRARAWARKNRERNRMTDILGRLASMGTLGPEVVLQMLGMVIDGVGTAESWTGENLDALGELTQQLADKVRGIEGDKAE